MKKKVILKEKREKKHNFVYFSSVNNALSCISHIHINVFQYKKILYVMDIAFAVIFFFTVSIK